MMQPLPEQAATAPLNRLRKNAVPAFFRGFRQKLAEANNAWTFPNAERMCRIRQKAAD